MSRDASDFDTHSFATDGTDRQFFDCPTVKVESAIDLSDFGNVQVSGTLESDLFLNEEADNRWGEIFISLFEPFYDRCQDGATACPVIRAQAGRSTAMDFITLHDGLAANTDWDRVHVCREQRTGPISVPGQGNEQVAAVSIEPGACFSTIEFDLCIGDSGFAQ